MKGKEVTGDTERTEAGEKRLHWSRDGAEGGWMGLLERMEERGSDGTDEPGSDASVEETSSEEPSRNETYAISLGYANNSRYSGG